MQCDLREGPWTVVGRIDERGLDHRLVGWRHRRGGRRCFGERFSRRLSRYGLRRARGCGWRHRRGLRGRGSLTFKPVPNEHHRPSSRPPAHRTVNVLDAVSSTISVPPRWRQALTWSIVAWVWRGLGRRAGAHAGRRRRQRAAGRPADRDWRSLRSVVGHYPDGHGRPHGRAWYRRNGRLRDANGHASVCSLRPATPWDYQLADTSARLRLPDATGLRSESRQSWADSVRIVQIVAKPIHGTRDPVPVRVSKTTVCKTRSYPAAAYRIGHPADPVCRAIVVRHRSRSAPQLHLNEVAPGGRRAVVGLDHQ
jgi:hypothetical protein